MAIDPKAFREEGEFEADMDEAIEVLHAVPPADPAKPVLVPGDPEAFFARTRLRDGIPVPDSLSAKLRAVCEGCGAPPAARRLGQGSVRSGRRRHSHGWSGR